MLQEVKGAHRAASHLWSRADHADPSAVVSPRLSARRARRIALAYIAIFMFFSTFLFVASYLRFALTGRWLIGEFQDPPGTHVFAAHTAIGSVVLPVLIAQLTLGAVLVVGRVRALAPYHRIMGRILVVIFGLFALQGVYISYKAGIFGQNLHSVYGALTLTMVAILCAYALINAVIRIRRGDLAGHMDNIVFFSIVLSSAGFVRFYAKASELTGYYNVEYFWDKLYLLTVYMIDWGSLGSAVTVFAATYAYVWQTNTWVKNRSMVILSSLFLIGAPLVILSSHVDALKLTERASMIKSRVTFGAPSAPADAR